MQKTWCAFFFLIAIVALSACDSSNPGQPGGDTSVWLNADENIAWVTKGNKSYTIDVSVHPTAKIDRFSVDVAHPSELNQANYPQGWEFPDELPLFTITNLAPAGGESVTVTITFPTTYEAGAHYFKATDAGFVNYPLAQINGNTVLLPLTDGGAGDDDDVPGQITDPGGPAVCTLTGLSLGALPEGVALFGYSGMNDSSRYFTQGVDESGLDNDEISHGHLYVTKWENLYEDMARFDVGTRQFVMGYEGELEKAWSIWELHTNGHLGAMTDSGHWHNHYETLVGFQVDGNAYVFGQDKESKYWFIQKINHDGTLGQETDNGTWYYYYDTVAPVPVGSHLYLFGQMRDTADDFDHNRWFLQEVNADGTMGQETAHGEWEHFFLGATAVQAGGHTYLFGSAEKKEHWYEPGNYKWFLQEVYENGTFSAHETDSGYWEHHYGSLASWRIDGNAYLFGQDIGDIYSGHSGSLHWFIQRVHTDGTMGNEVDAGHWNNPYKFVFPFAYDD